MSGWKKVKNLFWVDPGAPASSGDAPAAAGDGAELSDEEFAAMLAGQPQAVPAGVADAVVPEAVRPTATADGSVQIDFQAQYDEAGIPNTDEVEQLEAFLNRLDGSLPQASKVAAAEAFLGAIGKDRAAVLTDAERKIKRVRGVLAAHETEAKRQVDQEQAEIDSLMQAIDQRRKHMEDLNRQAEGVRRACQIEEARLQAAHVFFSNVTAKK
jgi:hypothetical protein